MLDLFEKHIDTDRLLRDTEVIYRHDQWSSFDQYARTAAFLVEAFGQAGADEVDRIPIPCDGQYEFGDWVMPLAWDAEDGTLELLDDSGRPEVLLADYRAVPNNLVRWCRPTAEGGETLPIVHLPDPDRPDAWREADVAGKLVFIHKAPFLAEVIPAVRHGAAGIVSDYSSAAREHPTWVQWQNAYTANMLWGTTKRDTPLLGFMISPERGEQLRRRLQDAAGPLSARARVKARFYEGTTDVVTAAITGSERPDQEIVFYSHVYECHIDDNAASAALQIEMARVLSRLVAEGTLPRPRRTIRFMAGWEWIGSEYYARFHKGDTRWLGSVCIDGVGLARRFSPAPFVPRLSPFCSRTYADVSFMRHWRRTARQYSHPFVAETGEYQSSSDTIWADPALGGTSNVYPDQTPGLIWHKSHSTAEQIDSDAARRLGACLLAWATELATADTQVARDLSQAAFTEAETAIHDYVGGFDFDRRDTSRAREQFAREIGILRDVGQEMIDTSELAEDDEHIRGTIEQLDRVVEQVQTQADGTLARIEGQVESWEASRPRDLRRDRDQRIAANIVPERLVKGGPWSFSRISEDERLGMTEPGIRKGLLWYLMDGQRSLLEVARHVEFEQGEPLDLRGIVRALRVLERGGYVRLSYHKTFTRDELAADLRTLGIVEGDTLLLHPSLTSIGPVEGGPEAVFGALEEVLGESGTLALPSFAFNVASQYPEPYDPRHTPSRVGALTDLFWRRDGVRRGRHPSHALAARGRHAARLVEDNVRYSPYDIRGAFGKLYAMDAKIVLMGCSLAPNSMLHALEDWADLPSMFPEAYHYVDEAGRRVEVTYQKEPQRHRNFYTVETSQYEREFRNRGLIREGDIGLARTFVMSARAVMDTGMALIRDGNVDVLYCQPNACPDCRQTRADIQAEWTFPDRILEAMNRLADTSD